MSSVPLPFVVAVALSAFTVGCGDPPTLSLEVTPGHETGSLSEDPAIAEIEIVARGAEGELELSAKAKLGGSFDLGEVPDTSIVTFELTGRGGDGAVLARGRSVSVPVAAVSTDVLSLFIQRSDRFARPPGEIVRSHVHAPGGVVAERFLVLTGGDAAAGAEGPADPAFGDYYDLLGLQGAESQAVLPRAARSLVVRGNRLILIGDDGASFADLDLGAPGELEAPAGLSFGDVSGGVALEVPGGTTLVVGATRPEGATAGVLVVDGNGALTGLGLSAARAGAAAAFVEGFGLVVAGGSPDAAGAEVIGEDLSVSALPFPADGVTGAAAVTLGEDRLALFGGLDAAGLPAPTRVLDLRCASACVPEVVAAILIPELVRRGRAFATSSATLVVGETAAGETLAFRASLGEGSLLPLPLREPRFGATPIPAPNGTLVVVGGLTAAGAPVRSVEMFFPE